MAGFDSRNALNLAIRALTKAALERNAGGWIPPKERERQQKEATRAEEKQKREAERAAKENGGSIGWAKDRAQKAIKESHFPEGRAKSHVAFINPIDFIHATTPDDEAVEDIFRSAKDYYTKEKLQENEVTPYLGIENGKIVGHEGRHRMAWLAQNGVTKAPVAIEHRGRANLLHPMENATFAPEYEGRRAVTVNNLIPLRHDYADQINETMAQHEDHFASGGQILSKQYPTQYMPHVGRQVMQFGGTPSEDLVGYHGSGDVFDSFDPTRAGATTGTEYGEAAAYLSKEEPVAEEYRNRAARKKGILFRGQPLREVETQGPEVDSARAEVADRIRDGYEPQEAIQKRAEHWLYFANHHKAMAEKEPENKEDHLKDAAAFEDRARLLLSLDPNDFARPKGHMYQVKVMAHPEHFLDWNKPFSEQSDHVREALTPTVEKIDKLYNDPKRRRGEIVSKYDQPQNMTGEKIYRFIQKHSKGDWSKAANPLLSDKDNHKYSTKYLKDLGIRGITYLDTTWNPANPPRNYAVYNPEDLQILKRYASGGSVHVNNISRPKFALGGTNATDEAVTSGLGQTSTEAGQIPFSGRVGRSDGNVPASDQAPAEEALEGLPTKVKIPKTGETLMAGPDPRIRQIARDYMAETGMPYNPPKKYAKVDPKRAQRIAQAFEEMPHDPEHPLVKSSYDALIKETMAQYNAAKKAGFKAEFWDPETQEDPYEASPRLAVEDIRKNHHMYVFPTRFGYGSGEPITDEEIKQNPMLQDSGETWNGQPVTVNDIFRAIHDYYGHAKEGVGFRHDGEENAWRAHASMFSPLARLAMTTETRGQNNWLNFGPHGEQNQKARTEDTVFADQKIGILPTWVHHEGAEDFMQPEDVEQMKNIYDQYSQKQGMARGGSIKGQHPALSIAGTHIREEEHGEPIFTGRL